MTQNIETRIIVKGLPLDLDEHGLRQLFSRFGQIMSANIVMTEKSEKYAIVTYDSVEDADKAMTRMNGYKVDNCELRVMKDIRRQSSSSSNQSEAVHRLFVGCLPKSYSSQDLRSLFTPFGDVKRAFVNDRPNVDDNYGFVYFDRHEEALTASKQLDGTVVNGNQINVYLTTSCNRETTHETHETIHSKQFGSDSLTTIDELDDELIMQILSHLTIKERFAVSRVCKLWKSICDYMLTYEQVLSFGLTNHTYYYGCHNSEHNASHYNNLSDAILDRRGGHRLNSIQTLAPIVHKTYNVECVQFANCFIDAITLKWMITQLPKLLCLRFDNIEGIGEREWTRITRGISGKLLHFSYGGNKLNAKLGNIVQQLTNLEEIIIFDYKNSMESLFRFFGQHISNIYVRDCARLDERAINFLIHNNSHIKDLKIHFVSDSNQSTVNVFDLIYSNINQIEKLFISNENDSEIKAIFFDLRAKVLVVSYKRYVDFSLLPLSLKQEVKEFHVRGIITPSKVNNISETFRNYQSLKLDNCKFDCECVANDTEYRCRNCYEKCISSIFKLNLN